MVVLLLLLCGELGALTPDTTQICGARAVQAYDLLYILYYAHVAMRLRRTRARTLSLYKWSIHVYCSFPRVYTT